MSAIEPAEDVLRQEIADSLSSPRPYVDRLISSSPMKRLQALWAGKPLPVAGPITISQAHLDALFTAHRYQSGYGGCTCGVDYEPDASELQSEFELHELHLKAVLLTAVRQHALPLLPGWPRIARCENYREHLDRPCTGQVFFYRPTER